jgi:hypothetical protein
VIQLVLFMLQKEIVFFLMSRAQTLQRGGRAAVHCPWRRRIWCGAPFVLALGAVGKIDLVHTPVHHMTWRDISMNLHLTPCA